MAQIYGQIGCLTTLIKDLKKNHINEFETMDDIYIFRNGYNTFLKKTKIEQREVFINELTKLESDHRDMLADFSNQMKERQGILKKELAEIKTKLANLKQEKRRFMRIMKFFTNRKLQKREYILKFSFEQEVEEPFKKIKKQIIKIKQEIEYRKKNADMIIELSVAKHTQEQRKALAVFRENRSLFYGAVGEEKALNELSKLPDNYHIINDYRLKFIKPIYNKKNNDRIYSVQIDSIVVGPTGIYLIEIKNWSKESVDSLDLFSPVQQIRRHNFAMFVLLNRGIKENDIEISSHHWGDRKVSPQNIMLLISHKPNQKFQYVEVLSLKEIRCYISQREAIFNNQDIASLIRFLLYI